MQANIQDKFDRMDALSLSGKPFFFMVDFLMKNSKIYTDNEILNLGLLIDFQNFTRLNSLYASTDKKIKLDANPIAFNEYKIGFDAVQNHLKKGNSYLVNYTAESEIGTDISLEDLFYHAKAKYKVCMPGEFLFFSPETFIEINENRIFTHPMKGTIDAGIPDAEQILRDNPKEKAEHYTVVDLLRNDLSMVADEVRVDEFQRMDLIKTSQKNLLAMSSEISGNLKPRFRGRVGSILQKLLPAGSILGAPKAKTLEIVLEAETHKRGWYSGVCGYFDGENLDSCVMIRFIEQRGGKKYFKSGGGITHMSDAQEEYAELKNKIYVPIH